MFVDPSDVVSLTHTSLIMTAILAKIFLKEKLTIAHFLGILLTAAGIIFITQPPFIFAHSSTKLTNSTLNKSIECLNRTIRDVSNRTRSSHECEESFNSSLQQNGGGRKSSESTQFGIVLTLIAAFLVSCTYLVIKKLTMRKVHWATNNIFVSLIGLPLSVVASILFVQFGMSHKNFAQEKKDLPMDLFYSILAALLANVAQIFLNLALQYEDTTKIAITKTTDVFIAFVLQFFLLSIEPDSMSMVGAMFIVLATFFVLAFKLLNVKYDQWLEGNNNNNNNNLLVESGGGGGEANKEAEVMVGNETSIKIELKEKILRKKSIKHFLLKLFFFQI